MILDTLIKRKHVYAYDMTVVPDEGLIDELLRMSHHITPSKQNVMPYHVNVLGPESKSEKLSIYNKVVGNHHDMEQRGLKTGQIKQVSGKNNPFYFHVKENPYLIVFSQRVVPLEDLNPYYTRQVKRGHFMEQCSPKFKDDIRSLICFEIGLFAQNLAAFLLENNLDYSFCRCFPGNKLAWKDMDFVEEDVLMLMSIGKAKRYRRDFLESLGENHMDTKMEYEKVVRFVKATKETK